MNSRAPVFAILPILEPRFLGLEAGDLREGRAVTFFLRGKDCLIFLMRATRLRVGLRVRGEPRLVDLLVCGIVFSPC